MAWPILAGVLGCSFLPPNITKPGGSPGLTRLIMFGGSPGLFPNQPTILSFFGLSPTPGGGTRDDAAAGRDDLVAGGWLVEVSTSMDSRRSLPAHRHCHHKNLPQADVSGTAVRCSLPARSPCCSAPPPVLSTPACMHAMREEARATKAIILRTALFSSGNAFHN